jgi:hypothetical protein
VVTSTMPDGMRSVLPDKSYVKDEQNGWTWGCHPEMTAAETQALKDVVLARRKCFAYKMTDLVGYHGAAGPFYITLDTDKPIFCKPRRYSALEIQITNEKCNELLEAGIIMPAPPNTKYASAATMPAKKDVHGNWTDKRFCHAPS